MSDATIVVGFFLFLLALAHLDLIFELLFSSMEVVLWSALGMAGLFLFVKVFKTFWLIT